MKDLTYPICNDCIHRINRYVTVSHNDSGKPSKFQTFNDIIICELGIELDRTPNYCPKKEARNV